MHTLQRQKCNPKSIFHHPPELCVGPVQKQLIRALILLMRVRPLLCTAIISLDHQCQTVKGLLSSVDSFCAPLLPLTARFNLSSVTSQARHCAGRRQGGNPLTTARKEAAEIYELTPNRNNRTNFDLFHITAVVSSCQKCSPSILQNKLQIHMTKRGSQLMCLICSTHVFIFSC